EWHTVHDEVDDIARRARLHYRLDRPGLEVAASGGPSSVGRANLRFMIFCELYSAAWMNKLEPTCTPEGAASRLAAALTTSSPGSCEGAYPRMRPGGGTFSPVAARRFRNGSDQRTTLRFIAIDM